MSIQAYPVSEQEAIRIQNQIKRDNEDAQVSIVGSNGHFFVRWVQMKKGGRGVHKGNSEYVEMRGRELERVRR